MNSKYIVVLLSCSLLFFGCINIDYESDVEQTFREDGGSDIEATGLFKIDMGTLGAMANMNPGIKNESVADPKTAISEAIPGFFDGDSFSIAICKTVKEGATCDVQTDGRYKIIASADQGDFYNVEKSMDYINLKEETVYTINKAPLATNYVSVQGEKFSQVLKEEMENYMIKAVEEELSKDKYPDYFCEKEGYSGPECTVENHNEGNLGIKFFDNFEYIESYIEWVGCTDMEAEGLSFKGADEIKERSVSIQEIGAVATKDGKRVNLNCPQGYDTIVVASKSESLVGEGQVERFTGYRLKSKEEYKQELLDQMQSSPTSPTSMINSQESEDTVHIIDFTKKKIGDKKYDEFLSTGSGGSTLGMEDDVVEVDIKYTANFPEEIVSAVVGNDEIKTEGKSIELDFDDIKELDKGAIIVRTQKSISPLGIFTWLIPVLVIVVIIGSVVFATMKKGKKNKRK